MVRRCASSSALLLAALFRPLSLIVWTATTTAPAVRAQEVYPTVRFTVYDGLSATARAAAISLGYTETSWNAVGTASIERLSYETIQGNSNTQASLISNQLGMNEDTWDCYMNHYDDYDWDELDDEGVQGSFINLGYSEFLWSLNIPPSTDNLDWAELSFLQRTAAEDICYFQETWDGESLPFDGPAVDILLQLILNFIQALLSFLFD